MVGPVYAAQVEKLRKLLESVKIHRPYAVRNGQDQMAAWSCVYDDVWGVENPKYDVQVRFRTLMAIPLNHQRMYSGWNSDMYELHAAVRRDYESTRLLERFPSGGTTSDGVLAVQDDRHPDTTTAPAQTQQSVKRLAEEELAPVSKNKKTKLTEQRPRKLEGPLASLRPGAPAQVDTVVADAPDTTDPDWDENLVRTIADLKPHQKHRGEVWNLVLQAVQKDTPHVHSVDDVRARFYSLLTKLTDETEASAHPTLCAMLVQYCKPISRKTLAMKAFLKARCGGGSLREGQPSTSAHAPAPVQPSIPSPRTLRPILRVQYVECEVKKNPLGMKNSQAASTKAKKEPKASTEALQLLKDAHAILGRVEKLLGK